MEYRSIVYKGDNPFIANSTIEHLKLCMRDRIPVPVESGPDALIVRYEDMFDPLGREYIVSATFDLPNAEVKPAPVIKSYAHTFDYKKDGYWARMEKRIEDEQRLKVSETYVFGVDIDESAITICKTDGCHGNIIRTLHGKEAVEFYNNYLEKEKNK